MTEIGTYTEKYMKIHISNICRNLFRKKNLYGNVHRNIYGKHTKETYVEKHKLDRMNR